MVLVRRLDVLRAALPPGEAVRSSRSVTLAPEPRQVQAARRFVTENAATLGSDDLDTLELLTSELVTNAVIHARTEAVLTLAVSDHYVLVTVHDLDLGRSELDPAAREGGWGLGLVTALADRSAQHLHPDGGKTAWFRLRRT